MFAMMCAPCQELALKFRIFPKEIKDQFNTLMLEHDKKFNPSGGLHSVGGSGQQKRSLDPVTQNDDEQGKPFPSQDSDPKTLAELGEISRVQGTGLYDLVVDAAGQLFILGLDDGVLTNKTELCQVRGNFVVGAPAQDARAKKTVLDWKITDTTDVVSATCKPVLNRAWSAQPAPLQDFLTYLEEEGCVRVKVIQHTVEKDEGKFIIKPSDDTVFVVEAGAKFKEKPHVQSLGNLVDFNSVVNSPHVSWFHRVCYEKQQNMIKSGYPGIFILHKYRIKKGDILKLTTTE